MTLLKSICVVAKFKTICECSQNLKSLSVRVWCSQNLNGLSVRVWCSQNLNVLFVRVCKVYREGLIYLKYWNRGGTCEKKRKGGHLVGDTRRWRKGKRKESRDINVKWMNFFKTRQDTLNRQRERGIDSLRLFLGTLR